MLKGRHLIIGTQTEKVATSAEIGIVNDSATSQKNDWFPRPVTRSDCFRDREIGEPCPFVGCRHHYAIDVYSSGAPRINAKFIDRPWNCSLDFIDANPNGSTLVKIGEEFGLTKERIRQIEDLAIAKIAGNGPDSLRELASYLHLGEESKKRIKDLYRIDLGDYRSEVTTTRPEEDIVKKLTGITSRLKRGETPEPKLRAVPIMTDDAEEETPKPKAKPARVPLAEFVDDAPEEEATVEVPKKPKLSMKDAMAARRAKAAAEAGAAEQSETPDPEPVAEAPKAKPKPKPKLVRPKKVEEVAPAEEVVAAEEATADPEPVAEAPKAKRGRPKKVVEEGAEKPKKEPKPPKAPKEPKPKKEPKPPKEKKVRVAKVKEINPRRWRLNLWEEAICAVLQEAEGMNQKQIAEEIGDFVREHNPDLADHYSVVRNSVRRLIALGWLKRGPKGVVLVSKAAAKVFSETGGKKFAVATKTKELSAEFIAELALDEDEVESIKNWLAGKEPTEIYLAAAMCRRLGTDVDALTIS